VEYEDNDSNDDVSAVEESTSVSPEEQIAAFHNNFPVFNCVVFDIPDFLEPGDANGFIADVSRIVKMTGKVIPLNSGCPLILFSPETDRELIAHRLSKTLHTTILFSFEADSPETVINTIQPLL
jgi:hypothetical protein